MEGLMVTKYFDRYNEAITQLAQPDESPYPVRLGERYFFHLGYYLNVTKHDLITHI